MVAEFEKSISIEVRKQEKLNIVEKQNFRREKLPEKYIVFMQNIFLGHL